MKFNINLLTDKEYMSKVKESIHLVSNQYLEIIGSCDFQCKSGINERCFFFLSINDGNKGGLLYHTPHIKKVKDKREKSLRKFRRWSYIILRILICCMKKRHM